MKVLVVGGGIAGLTLAYWLDRQGISTTVIEQAPTFRPIGSMTTMHGEGRRIAEQMGIGDRLRAAAFKQARQEMFDANGRLLRGFNLKRTHALHGDTLTLRRADWHRAILDTIPQRVPIRRATTIVTADQDDRGVDVSFSDGGTERYDLVIGADGVHSSVRRLGFGTGHERPVDLGLMTFILDGVEPLLTRLDLAPYTVHEWFLPGRYVELTTLDRNVVAGIFVYRSLPEHRVPPAAERVGFLLAQFGEVSGAPPTVIRAIADPQQIYCDDMAQVVLPRWSVGRMALVGDAAYALTPMLGVGGGKAMRGAYVLAKELSRTEPADYAAAFARYEEAIRPAVDLLQRQTRRMAAFALDGRPPAMLLKRTLFRYLPERLVARMRSAPPKGTAFEDGLDPLA